MSEFKFNLTFTQRQKVLAARKPYESFKQTLQRLIRAALEDAPASSNVKALRRSEKRWPMVTERVDVEQEFARHLATLRRLGISESAKTLRKKWDLSREWAIVSEHRKDPSNWTNEHDLDVDVVHACVMADLRSRSKGRAFRLYDLVERACPKVHRIPSPSGNPVMERLLRSPQFMRSVRHVEGQGYFDIKLKKL